MTVHASRGLRRSTLDALEESWLLPVGVAAMSAFVLFGAGTAMGWVDARHGLWAGVVAALMFFAVLGLALSGPRAP